MSGVRTIASVALFYVGYHVMLGKRALNLTNLQWAWFSIGFAIFLAGMAVDPS